MPIHKIVLKNVVIHKYMRFKNGGKNIMELPRVSQEANYSFLNVYALMLNH